MKSRVLPDPPTPVNSRTLVVAELLHHSASTSSSLRRTLSKNGTSSWRAFSSAAGPLLSGRWLRPSSRRGGSGQMVGAASSWYSVKSLPFDAFSPSTRKFLRFEPHL